MIKGLIMGPDIVFNASEFLYAEVTDFMTDYQVRIFTKDNREICARVGSHECCIDFIQSLRLV